MLRNMTLCNFVISTREGFKITKMNFETQSETKKTPELLVGNEERTQKAKEPKTNRTLIEYESKPRSKTKTKSKTQTKSEMRHYASNIMSVLVHI